MKYFCLLAVSALMFTFMACGDAKSVDATTETSQTLSADGSTPQTLPVMPGSLDSQAHPIAITPSGTTGAGLNPEHGQPGHRCELAVGAPLNGKPAEQTTPAVTTAPSMTTSPSTTPFTISSDKPAQPAATKAGLNPAHGEPGHRCDLAVGVPLDTKQDQKPVSNETTPINITTDQAVKTEAKPEVKTEANTIPVVAEGMNPPHGQPGHRCDLAVGVPLNTKQTTAAAVPQAPVNNQIIPSVVPIKPTQDTKKNNR